MQEINTPTLIIGGGVAGMQAAVQLQKLGIKAVIVEKAETLGGHLNEWYKVFPGYRPAEEVRSALVGETADRKIAVVAGDEVTAIRGQYDNYVATTKAGRTIKAESVLLATGFQTFDARLKEEYGYGLYPNVITSADLERRLRANALGPAPRRVAMVHCVGSRDEKIGNLHCSKVCCVTAVKQAIELRELYPQADVVCLYMDLRMYDNGFEELYREAQLRHGVKFVRGRLSECAPDIDGALRLKVQDTLLGLPMQVSADLLVLMVGKEAAPLPALDASITLGRAPAGFLAPADVHLRPNTCTQPGFFCCGAACGPKTLQEAMADGKSAAADIFDYLSKK